MRPASAIAAASPRAGSAPGQRAGRRRCQPTGAGGCARTATHAAMITGRDHGMPATAPSVRRARSLHATRCRQLARDGRRGSCGQAVSARTMARREEGAGSSRCGATEPVHKSWPRRQLSPRQPRQGAGLVAAGGAGHAASRGNGGISRASARRLRGSVGGLPRCSGPVPGKMFAAGVRIDRLGCAAALLLRLSGCARSRPPSSSSPESCSMCACSRSGRDPPLITAHRSTLALLAVGLGDRLLGGVGAACGIRRGSIDTMFDRADPALGPYRRMARACGSSEVVLAALRRPGPVHARRASPGSVAFTSRLRDFPGVATCHDASSTPARRFGSWDATPVRPPANSVALMG